MTETRYKDYTPREASAKTKTKLSRGGFLGRFLIGLVVSVGLSVGGFFWLKSQLAELLAVNQPTTLVLVDPQPGSQVGPWILQFQPDAKKSVFVNLAPETLTELFSGYGQYSVAAVYPLLMIENKSPAYIQASLGAISGRLISRVVPWAELKAWQQQVQASQMLLSIDEREKKLRGLAIAAVKEIVTTSWQKIWLADLSYEARIESMRDFKTSLSWYWFTQQARFKWQFGTELSDLVATAFVSAADCPVAVINATQSQGLAKQIGTLLTNTGYEVIRISAETAAIEDSALWLDPNQADKCHDAALAVAGSIPTVPQVKLDAEKTLRYRAPIVLVVGLDNAR